MAIANSNMSNPISATRPNFGQLTFKHNGPAPDISSLVAKFSSINVDNIDRSPFKGDVGKELALSNFK